MKTLPAHLSHRAGFGLRRWRQNVCFCCWGCLLSISWSACYPLQFESSLQFLPLSFWSGHASEDTALLDYYCRQCNFPKAKPLTSAGEVEKGCV